MKNNRKMFMRIQQNFVASKAVKIITFITILYKYKCMHDMCVCVCVYVRANSSNVLYTYKY